jgi:hypothetical protein
MNSHPVTPLVHPSSETRKYIIPSYKWEEITTDYDPYYYYDLHHKLDTSNFMMQSSVTRKPNETGGEAAIVGTKEISADVLRVFWNAREDLQINIVRLRKKKDYCNAVG